MTGGSTSGQVIRYGDDFAPQVIAHTKGSYNYAARGRKILDFTSCQMSGILGHSNAEIVAVVQKMAAYDYTRRLKMLGRLAPFQFTCKIRTNDPRQFKVETIRNTRD